MFVIYRSHLAAKLALFTAAAGAAGITGLTQASAADLPAFTCTDASGGSSGVTGTVTRVEVAHHDGYDRLVIGFATSLAVPPYDVHRQSTSTFTRDASGQPVTLAGSTSLRVVLRGSDIANGVPSDLKPSLPEIREVANTGDFERVVSYGVGLTDQACLRVFELSSPSRLVIDVQTPAVAAASNQLATSTTSTAPTAANLAATGHQILSPSPLAGEGRGGGFAMILGLSFLLAVGLTLSGLRRRLARK